MREYFEFLEDEFIASKVENLNLKTLLERGEITLYRRKKENGSLYFVQTSGDFMDSRVQQTLLETTTIALRRSLKSLGIKRGDLVMVVGVGNGEMIADSLGPRVVSQVSVSAHLNLKRFKGNLCAFSSGVKTGTGVESFEVTKALVKSLRPKAVIAVDTLASSTIERLGNLVQIKNGELTPGAGVGNQKKTLEYSTLGVPVIGVGVPLIIHAKNIVLNYLNESEEKVLFPLLKRITGNLDVTAKEIDLYVSIYSKIIAMAINRSVHGISIKA